MIHSVVSVIIFLIAFLVSRFMVKKRVLAAAPHRMYIGKTSSTEIEEMKEVARKVMENDQDVWKESKYKISKILDGTNLLAKVEERGTEVRAWLLDGSYAFKTTDNNWSEKGAITFFTIIYGLFADIIVSLLILALNI